MNLGLQNLNIVSFNMFYKNGVGCDKIMKKTIICIGIISLFLITGLTSIASAGVEYQGFVTNLKQLTPQTSENDGEYTATSLIGHTTDGRWHIFKEIKLHGIAFRYQGPLLDILVVKLKEGKTVLLPMFVAGYLVE
jgi:hypothetical protein